MSQSILHIINYSLISYIYSLIQRTYYKMVMTRSDSRSEDLINRGSILEHPDGHWKYGEKIFQLLRQNPRRIGQLDAKTEKEDTFENILDRSVRCGLWMKQQGIKPGDIIALCSHNQFDSTVVFLGALFIGAVCNPWWEMYLEEDLIKYFLELTEPNVIFASVESAAFIQEILTKVKSNIKVIVLGKVLGMQSFHEILSTQNSEKVINFQCEKIERPDHPAILIYTSGTTGRPKGVILSCGSLSAGVSHTEDKKLVNSRGFWCSSLCWISAVIGIINCFVKGATVIVYPNPSESELCELIEKFKINFLIIGTGVANRLFNTKESLTCDLSSVNLLFFGGAIVKREIEQYLLKIFPNASIFQSYGATELAGGTTLARITESSKACTCGKPTNNVEIKVIDPSTGKVLGPNEDGEVCFRSPYVMNGYFKNPEATARVIDSDGWYHSDDLGYYDGDGDLYIVDRLKELIKCKLYDIAPGPIEKCIQGHPSVAEVAVVAKPYSQEREQPMAFVTKLPGMEVTAEEIMELVEDKLSNRIKLYGGVEFLNEMPYTASGKIAKKQLRNLARQLAQSNYELD